jgi:hypothetical protein
MELELMDVVEPRVVEDVETVRCVVEVIVVLQVVLVRQILVSAAPALMVAVEHVTVLLHRRQVLGLAGVLWSAQTAVDKV